MLTNQLMNVTNKRVADLDSIILVNANSTIKLIDMQIQMFNELEDQTEDKQLLNQVGEQLSLLKDARLMVSLVHKIVVQNALSEHEKKVLMRILSNLRQPHPTIEEKNGIETQNNLSTSSSYEGT
ncbi:peptidase M23 [Paenibacillus sp. MWE-103]|uniref:Peptidase M23 n=1 Tax=Paenibacillus artemisiicola TaxID=1172618 RepID=A0ABS3WHX0_9BACL|nr:peptidase M23 [Paenibacillus artemisiicola]MBO7747917.1 peptidase M23 [Paenibacillus artemisiicola]